MRGVKVFLVLAALTAGICGTARADLFTFSYSGSGFSASGTITATLQSGNQYLITGISGTRSGQSITGLIAAGGFTNVPYGTNDNLLFYPPGGLYLDTKGFAYTTADGGHWDAYYESGFSPSPYGEAYNVSGGFTSDGAQHITSINFDAAPGPIPGAGALSYLVVLLGGLVRWRKTVVASVRRATHSALHWLRAHCRGLAPPAPAVERGHWPLPRGSIPS